MNIVRTQRYVKDLKRMGVSDGEQAVLEKTIAENAESGSLIPGQD
jgi:hypothetical protein